MDPRTSVALEGHSFDNTEQCWPTWEGYFDDSFTAAMNTPQSLAMMEGQSHRTRWRGSHSSRASFSPCVSETASATASPTPIIVPDEASKEMRIMKRKAQNRAAQRAHRERQLVRLKGLHDRIDQLQDRCKQLQARNRQFEAAFQRFFQDGVALLGSKADPDISEAIPDNVSSDDVASELGMESQPMPMPAPSISRRSAGAPGATQR